LKLDEVDDPTDRAWLSTHGARCLLEHGHKQESLDLALEASTIGAFFTDDPTALLISAAAFTCGFSATDLAPQYFEPMLRANDLAPSWWRSQQRAWALSAHFDQEFEVWAGKRHSMHSKETTAWQQLRSIVLTSGVAGDHQAWRSATAQLAYFELMKSSRFGDDEYATALRNLRLAGDENAVGLAVRKLRDDGPCHAVAIAGHHLDFLKSTRTSLASDIRLVTTGADLLSDSDAERHAAWALEVLTEPARIQPLTQSVRWTCRYLVDMLGSLSPRLGREAMEAIRNFLAGMPYLADQLLADRFARLVRTIGSEGWTEHQVSGVRRRLTATEAALLESASDALPDGKPESTAEHDEQALADVWRWLLSEAGDEAHKQRLLIEAAEGSREALLTIGDVTGFPIDVAARIIGHLGLALAAQREDAREGRAEIGALDEGSTLLKMNLNHPKVADWEPIVDLLKGPAFPEQQAETIWILAQNPGRIPPSVIAALMPHLREIADQPSDEHFSFNGMGNWELARQAVDALQPELTDPHEIARRLSYGREAKQTLARTLGAVGEESHLLLLASLAGDSESIVRAAAAWAATRWIVRDIHPAFALQLVDKLLDGSGTRVAFEVTRAIPHEEDLTRMEPILRKPQLSDSAAVRRRAAELQLDGEQPEMDDADERGMARTPG
jgi:hypothetical protein